MFQQLRDSLRAGLVAARGPAPAESRTGRARKPRFESLEGRAMCDGGESTFNNGAGTNTGTIQFDG